MIQQKDFDKYCKKDEDYIRIQNTERQHGDLCFVIDHHGFVELYHCGNGLYFGKPIRSIGNMKRIYQMLTNTEMKERTIELLK